MVFGDYAISSFNDQKHAAKGDLGRLGARKEGFMSKQSKKLTRQEKLEQKDKAYEERLKNRQEKALAALSDQEEEMRYQRARNAKEKPVYINLCTFTRDVYKMYLKGSRSKWTDIIAWVMLVVFACIIVFGVGWGIRLDIIGAGLGGCLVCSLIVAQPWFLARAKIAKTEIAYGGPQKNSTRFYEDHMTMMNLSAQAEATAEYTEITRLRETEDFIFMYVGRACYFALLTGFTKGEDEIQGFKEFIVERAVNATKNDIKMDGLK